VTPPDDHLDLDAAAELDEGIDDGSRRAHVATCDECNSRLAQVRTTRALLSALPEEAMPGDVADRLHAALPREPVLTTIVPRGNRRRRWTSSPALAGLIAAAAAIALVAAISIGSLRSSDQPSSAGAGAGAGTVAAPRAPSTNFPVLSSGLHYTDANATGFIARLDQLTRSPVTLAPSGGASAAGRAAAQKDTLTLSEHQPVAAPLRSLFGDRQQLLACARLLAGGPVEPLAIDFARFTGGSRHLHNAPAMIVLLPGAGSLRDSAFIVGPRCTTDSSQDIYTFVQAPQR
jgi:anti-sigma factor RsiW